MQMQNLSNALYAFVHIKQTKIEFKEKYHVIKVKSNVII